MASSEQASDVALVLGADQREVRGARRNSPPRVGSASASTRRVRCPRGVGLTCELTGSLEARGTGELADDREPPVPGSGVNGRTAPSLVEQYGAVWRGDAACQRMVRLVVELRPRPTLCCRLPVQRSLQHSCARPAVEDQLRPTGPGPAPPRQRRRSLSPELQAASRGRGPAASAATRSWTAPQSETTNPFEAPLVPQHLGEQPGVLRRIRAVDPVVGAHDGPGFRSS